MNDFKSVAIGFLLATCMFLIMGQTSSKAGNAGVGRYQISTTYRALGGLVFETTIDTKSGKVVSRKAVNGLLEYKTN